LIYKIQKKEKSRYAVRSQKFKDVQSFIFNMGFFTDFLLPGEMSVSHGGEYEDDCLLGCAALW
jgi:hypothetical protein